MDDGIGCSGVKLHNDDRKTVRGRSESASAGKDYDSTETITALDHFPPFFFFGGINLTCTPLHSDDICCHRANH